MNSTLRRSQAIKTLCSRRFTAFFLFVYVCGWIGGRLSHSVAQIYNPALQPTNLKCCLYFSFGCPIFSSHLFCFHHFLRSPSGGKRVKKKIFAEKTQYGGVNSNCVSVSPLPCPAPPVCAGAMGAWTHLLP